MMMMNTLMQQMPVINGANLVAMSIGINQRQTYDPLAEIRNG